MGSECDVPLTTTGQAVAQSLSATNKQLPAALITFEGASVAAAATWSYYAGGEVFNAATSLSPEFWGEIDDFVGGFDPNPAAPFAATVGGITGWAVSGGAADWWNCVSSSPDCGQ
jgi:hypothetical protein